MKAFLCSLLILSAPNANAQLIGAGFWSSKVTAPTLSVDFTSGGIPAGFTFSRASTGTYYNSSGVLVTASANTPRFDTDPTTLGARGLLMEPAATNLLPYSTCLDNVAANNYSYYYINTSGVVNSAVAPDGTTTATQLIESASGSATQYAFGNAYVQVPNNAPYTFSFFGKAGTINGFNMIVQDTNGNYDGVFFELSSNGIVRHGAPSAIITGYGIQALPNGWYRMFISMNAGSGAGTVTFSARLYDTVADLSWYVSGSGGRYAYVWGAQLEAGSTPTSFIPTVASAVSRSADQLSTGSLGWYDPSVGTLFAQYVSAPRVSTSGAQVFGLFGTNAAGTFTQNSESLVDRGTTFAGIVNTASSTQFTRGSAVSAFGAVNKIALAYAGQNFAAAANGALSGSSSSGSTPTASYGYIGSQPDSASTALWIQKIRYYRQRLNNFDLTQLTQ